MVTLSTYIQTLTWLRISSVGLAVVSASFWQEGLLDAAHGKGKQRRQLCATLRDTLRRGQDAGGWVAVPEMKACFFSPTQALSWGEQRSDRVHADILRQMLPTAMGRISPGLLLLSANEPDHPLTAWHMTKAR
eukprot:1681189-Amphidinium_carterae.1